MTRVVLATVVGTLMVFAFPVEARYSSGSHHGGGGGHSHGGSHSSGHHRSTYATGVTRDSHGRIKRSEEAKRQFERETGYPHGRPGYVIDHVKPLADGGSDSPGNMQWQTVADAKAKDKWERGPSHSTSHRSHRHRHRRAA